MSARMRTTIVLLVLAAAGCVSGCGSGPPPPPPGTAPFTWSADARWEAYETAFREARAAGCEAVDPAAAQGIDRLTALTDSLAAAPPRPDDARLDRLEEALFSAAARAAVCRARLPDFQRAYARMRAAVKAASVTWDLDERPHRVRLYRLLYGGRAAIEEAMLQGPLEDALALLPGDAPLHPGVPSAGVSGVVIQSGDILLSRGGAASSALIARGNDFPGNFSHAALAVVDARTGQPSVVEAHIEMGVVPTDAAGYLSDRKLRILVLRLRPDLPAVRADSLLPHRAGEDALAEARRRHIPYDFALDFTDPERMFCSEVAYAAYAGHGVALWMGLSTMSAPGLMRWLYDVGVRHFETHEPSDLEYDPQLQVVAEWIDPETLWKDHVDNAVIDVMLEGADAGDDLEFNAWKLPVAAAGKAWSWMLNRFGRVGPVPEGMGPVTALRIQSFTDRHARIVAGTLERAAAYEARSGYRPPYWDLVALAREARDDAG